jgi:acyl-CoA hydrolase
MLPDGLKDYSLVTQHLVMTEHLNPNHHIFGGQLMAWLDKDLYLFACRELRYKKFATLSMNNVRFRNPANLGDILQIFGSIKEVRRSSVSVFGQILAFEPEHDSYREVIACEITYVALNERGKPARILPERG